MKKIISFIFCFCLIFNIFLGCLSVNAVGEECEVYVDKITAIPGDVVYVNLNIRNNPGIMAMTISVTYDSSILEYIDYFYGDIFTDYTVANHTSRNLIRVVISQKKDFLGDGVIASFKFKVKESADADLHKITVEYSSGDFCNNDLVRLMPTIIPGGVDVSFTGNNCLHKKYSEWEKILEPSCEGEGAYSRTCEKCGHFDSKTIPPVGHEFSSDWVVDIPATKEEAGTMSRHCIRCEKVTDETNFFLEDVEDSEIDNKYDGEVPENDVVSDIITEQHPEIDFDNLGNTSNETSSNNQSDSSQSSNQSQNNSTNSTSGESSKTENNSTTEKPNNSEESSKVNSSIDKNDSSSEIENSDNANTDVTSSNSNTDNSNTTNKDNQSIAQNNSNSSSNNKDNTKPQTDKEKTENKIEDLFEIITPEDDNTDKAQSVASILREKIPNFDSLYKYLKFAIIIIFILILL